MTSYSTWTSAPGGSSYGVHYSTSTSGPYSPFGQHVNARPAYPSDYRPYFPDGTPVRHQTYEPSSTSYSTRTRTAVPSGSHSYSYDDPLPSARHERHDRPRRPSVSHHHTTPKSRSRSVYDDEIDDINDQLRRMKTSDAHLSGQDRLARDVREREKESYDYIPRRSSRSSRERTSSPCGDREYRSRSHRAESPERRSSRKSRHHSPPPVSRFFSRRERSYSHSHERSSSSSRPSREYEYEREPPRRERSHSHSYSHSQSSPQSYSTRSQRPHSPPPQEPFNAGKKPRTDLYTVLGVSRTASSTQIKAAYRKLALRYHPDKVHASVREQTSDVMAELNLANDILCDEEKRAKYDATRRI